MKVKHFILFIKFAVKMACFRLWTLMFQIFFSVYVCLRKRRNLLHFVEKLNVYRDKRYEQIWKFSLMWKPITMSIAFSIVLMSLYTSIYFIILWKWLKKCPLRVFCIDANNRKKMKNEIHQQNPIYCLLLVLTCIQKKTKLSSEKKPKKNTFFITNENVHTQITQKR